jgi:hypothetical protein
MRTLHDYKNLEERDDDLQSKCDVFLVPTLKRGSQKI